MSTPSTLADADRWSPASLTERIGQEVGTSSWIEVDQERINTFAHCTMDPQWIHVDPERARAESPFGATVAHGFLTLSLLAPTGTEVLVSRFRLSAAVNYGLDRVRFIAPVRAGRRIRNRIRLTAVEPRGPGRWLLTTENTIEIDGEDKPALQATGLVLLVE